MFQAKQIVHLPGPVQRSRHNANITKLNTTPRAGMIQGGLAEHHTPAQLHADVQTLDSTKETAQQTNKQTNRI
jgi:hypothetical protein